MYFGNSYKHLYIVMSQVYDFFPALFGKDQLWLPSIRRWNRGGCILSKAPGEEAFLAGFRLIAIISL